jgi:hypothetical protein
MADMGIECILERVALQTRGNLVEVTFGEFAEFFELRDNDLGREIVLVGVTARRIGELREVPFEHEAHEDIVITIPDQERLDVVGVMLTLQEAEVHDDRPVLGVLLELSESFQRRAFFFPSDRQVRTTVSFDVLHTETKAGRLLSQNLLQ